MNKLSSYLIAGVVLAVAVPSLSFAKCSEGKCTRSKQEGSAAFDTIKSLAGSWKGSHMKEGKKDEALKLLPKVYKVIDTAAKKNIIHKNNAARKKSLYARMVAAK